MPIGIPFELPADRPLILDGGLATELERTGHNLDHPLWSANILGEKPDAVAGVHRSYADAGADILTAATYQATFSGFRDLGLNAEESAEVFRNALRIAREAAGASSRNPVIAVSIGSYGAFLADGSEYRGAYGKSEAQLAEFHRDRLEFLAGEMKPGDLFAFETLPSALEARVLADLLSEFPDRAAWFSFSCRNGRELCDGTPIEEIVRHLHDYPGIAAVGVNCIAPRFAEELVKRIGRETGRPIILYPNSGEIWDRDQAKWQGRGDAEVFARQALGWHQAGASIIGGCCRTTPEHIRRLREIFDRACGISGCTLSDS